MRQLYESDKDKAEERRIADILQARWNCQVTKLPNAYNLDYACHRMKELRWFVEIKSRNCFSTAYPDIILSLHKVFAARQFAAETSKKCFFVVQWLDRLAYANILKETWPIAWGGRDDRNDWQDKEPVALIPIRLFRDVVPQ